MSATKHANKTTPTQPKKLLDGEYYSCILIFFRIIPYLYFVSKRFVQTIYTPPNPAPKLLDSVRDRLRVKHYSFATKKLYVHWIKRFILFKINIFS